ncbi:MAG: hypothetical protein DCF25_03285 [Leptolyngbya foveolarum]|uniref:Uncharacterized protein n=1 Tax=Leptolyngbya foveolarum TaxID=47253 RepID=A0A2W4UQ51_9CYAN|nr:MAG: hypothetical protein DCF25_03285 [Leptolyngbya foveolarum]
MSNVQRNTERASYGWQKALSKRLKIGLSLAGIAIGCTVSPMRAIADADEVAPTEIEEGVVRSPAANTFQQAAALATEAVATAQTAATAPQWDTVVAQWLEAIALLQTIPPESPSRLLAQRQIRGYLQQLQDAQRRAEQSSPGLGTASLGSDLFNAQLAGYLSYVETVGTPDVLIVGSSRALQGIDPHELQQALAAQGYADINVYNFSVNGATAQVVEFMMGNLLPEPLPPVVVWGDGSRAFNEGRRDRTWESLRSSPAYRSAQTMPGALAFSPVAKQPMQLTRRITANSPLIELPGNLDVLGFSAVSDRFNPQTYYQQTPKVEGRYDGAYDGFALDGAQADALGRIAANMQGQNVQLMFVNLPLSGSYLDNFRLYYEQQFQRFLQTQSSQKGFALVDLLTQWENQPGFFADPSHINQDGARAIARQLAQQPALTNALNSIRSSDPSSEPSAEPPPSTDLLLERLRPTQIDPNQSAPVRRPPPPVPPTPPNPPN